MGIIWDIVQNMHDERVESLHNEIREAYDEVAKAWLKGENKCYRFVALHKIIETDTILSDEDKEMLGKECSDAWKAIGTLPIYEIAR